MTFAHGFDKKKFFGRDASDRLFHILILLSLIKDKRLQDNTKD